MAKILVIDDSGFFRSFVRGVLEEAGHEVEDLALLSALEVMEHCKTFNPDLVVTDYTMPNVDGLAVVRMVRRFRMDLPVVVLTADHDPERVEKLKGYPPLRILFKPIKAEALAAELTGMLT
jgi:CheY-like chemotaxis protein